ncbi:peptide ABC transporter substrate-binding protein [Alicyclobacillus fastidiosus]|uniref:Peptide ABC transporter substrate-binding protein n=1 Tax=Alicyclobacillus fastidiosus TaxID=392011 RepID=A0ABY6ZMD6_9BACL|nr:peptide ABC transporter substrate-binding protein [Alicyclobacillus fastidiosus]WAH44093.1 peptide ABC transporter substrate-binding protein [Alicyclobacillus fastidiosus]GMA60387.1 peptide ABC transporter substrate-binding protein [Alicyclobacillus fastidiosus]
MRKAKISALAAATVFSATALTGCSQTSASHDNKTASPTAVTIPLPTTPTISTLDPSQWGAQILIDQGTVMEGLYGYSPTGKIVPKIATHYTVSKDGLVWTFYLRHNAKWSNGKPVTANDFYYAWMRVASPDNTTGAVWASVMTYVKNVVQYHAGSVPASQVGLKVINPYEIQLTLSVPHNILGAMVISGSMPLYAPSIKAHPNDWYLPQNFVGDGPYIIKSFMPNGKITLVRNPNYVGAPGEVNVGNVQMINVIPGPTVPVEDFMADRLDAAVIPTPSDYRYVVTHPQLKAQLHSQSDNQVEYLEWDKSTEASPLEKLQVRQAIAMAIDRAPIVNNVLSGMGGITNVFGFPGWPTYSLQKPLPYDVQKAQQLLAQAGYPGGKGMPTLYLYTQTTSDNPNSVPIAEALAEELKQNLDINFKIVPEASTMYGNIVWGGLNQGIHPGYVVGGGTPNFSDANSLPIGANQEVLFAGTVGPLDYRVHASNYYYPTYDPDDVKEFGNPDNPNMGVKWSDWLPLQKAAEADIKYLDAWTAKQPAAYQKVLVASGQATNAQQWTNLMNAWKQAKTPADKHTAWVNAWKFVGDYSAGNGGANIGLNGQVWDDEHMPHDVYLATMWNAELNGAISQKAEDDLTANIDNFMLQQGYGIPLYYFKTFYLEKPGLTGIEANPWSWGNLFQMQYLHTN